MSCTREGGSPMPFSPARLPAPCADANAGRSANSRTPRATATSRRTALALSGASGKSATFRRSGKAGLGRHLPEAGSRPDVWLICRMHHLVAHPHQEGAAIIPVGIGPHAHDARAACLHPPGEANHATASHPPAERDALLRAPGSACDLVVMATALQGACNHPSVLMERDGTE